VQSLEVEQLPAHAPALHATYGAHVRVVPCGGPLATLVQVPSLPLTSQAWQLPLHLVSQHMPSTQLPLWQLPSAVQATPFASFTAHDDPLQ
jgi:hypothetical protein